MASLTFAAVGDNCIDRFLPPVSESLVGGNAVNVAVQLKRLGQAVAYFGAVGDDADGQRTIETLARNGVEVENVHRLPVQTAYTDIAVDAAGDRTMAFEEFGACRDYRPTPGDLGRMLAARHVHIGWLNDGGSLRERLVAHGVSVSQDVSVNAEAASLGVSGLNVAFASAGEDPDRARRMVAELLGAGAKCAVVTCGALGSTASDGAVSVQAAIRSVEVLDTTGAGDSFIAGFLDARHRGQRLQACLEAGRDAAARTCTHVGGFPQTPLRWIR